MNKPHNLNFIVFTVLLWFTSCSSLENKKLASGTDTLGKTEKMADRIEVENLLLEAYPFSDEMPDSGFIFLCEVYEQMVSNFKAEQSILSYFSIEFFGAYDITSTTFVFYPDEKIRFAVDDNASEGGYEEKLFEYYENDSTAFFSEYVNSGGESSHRLWMKGMDHVVVQTTKWDQNPEISIEEFTFNSEENSVNPSVLKEKSILEWLKSTAENEFRKDGSQYIYRRSAMENSDYGPIDTGREIRMDSLCFRKFFPKR